MTSSRITIVTPSFNQKQYLMEALESVRSQKHADLEHLVVDGNSNDGSVELLKEVSAQPGWEHLSWVSEPDRGQSDALNKGFRRASGDLVGWLNADDRYRPGCFDNIVDAATNSPNADVFYGDYTWIDRNGCLRQIRREIEFNRFILLYHKVLFIPTTSTFFRRRVFEHGEFVDERFHYAMDFEYFVRLAMKGYRFQHVPGLLADFRWHGENKSALDPRRQRAEQNDVVQSASGFLRHLPPGAVRDAALFGTRQIAGVLRYSEKLLRGYYVEQFLRPRVQS